MKFFDKIDLPIRMRIIWRKSLKVSKQVSVCSERQYLLFIQRESTFIL